MRRHLAGAVGLATVVGLTVTTTTTSLAAPGRDGTSPAQREALGAGIQIAPKGSAAPEEGGEVNPYLANLPSLEDADYFTWNKQMRAAAERRAGSARLRDNRRAATAAAPAPAFVHDEEEPAGTRGSNDTWQDAEPIPGFGTRANRNPRVRILGGLADLGDTPEEIEVEEDNGAIPIATETGIEGSGAVGTASVLGDGPHGSDTGDGSNDFEFFTVDVGEGQSVVASTVGSASGTDTVLAVYDAEGTVLAANDDSGGTLQSELGYTPETPGTYHVLVAGYDPFGPLARRSLRLRQRQRLAPTRAATWSTSGCRSSTGTTTRVRLRPGDTVGAVGDRGRGHARA